MNLRPYQEEAIQAFLESVKEGTRRGMIILPTGTGKTVLGLSLAKAVGGRVLWLAHREELITQPIKALRHIWPGKLAGVVKAGRNEYARDFVFASIQSAWRPKRLAKLKNFDLVVVDECHHAAAKSYKTVLEHVGCLKDDGPPLLGLTATPERTDNFQLDDIFQKIVYQFQLRQAVESGYLVNVEMVPRPIRVNLDQVGSLGGDFKENELDLALLNAGIIDEVCDTVDELAKDKKTIIFTVSVKQAEEIAKTLKEKGYRADYVSGKTPSELRRKKLKQLTKGDITHMVNCMVFTEGFDEPTVDCIIMARPTQSKSLYIQCVGRGLRVAPNKDRCLIIDMVGMSKRHTLIQAPVIFGIEGEVDDTREPLQKSDDIDDFLASDRQKSTLLSQVAGIRGVVKSKLKWIPSGNDLILNCGQGGTIVMRAGSENDWMVEIIDRGNRGNREYLTMDPVDLELAQGIAEDYVRRSEAVYLTNKTARWRSAPATPAQLKALKKWKVNFSTDITKGEASDLLTKVTVKNNWRNDPATPKQRAALRMRGIQFNDNITKGEAGKLMS